VPMKVRNDVVLLVKAAINFIDTDVGADSRVKAGALSYITYKVWIGRRPRRSCACERRLVV